MPPLPEKRMNRKQKTYKQVLFDLDGTLTDPMEGITKAVAHALAHYGIHIADRRTLVPFIGPPLQDSFRRFFGFTPEQADEACERYNDYFLPKGIFENQPYEGIDLLLARLKAEGRTLLVATTKPEPLAERILTHFGLRNYFDEIGGDTMERTRSDKAAVIAHVMEKAGIGTRTDEAVMVGDTEYDIAGARKVGMDSIGVLYGYGDEQALLTAGPTMTARSIDELGRLL